MSVNPLDLIPPRPPPLNAHTIFITTHESSKAIATRGVQQEANQFLGVGLHLDPDDLSVRQVSKLVSAGGQLLGMSAVEVGDVLQFVDDCPIQQVSNDLVERALLGMNNTAVKLTFMSSRRNHLYDISLRRHNSGWDSHPIWASKDPSPRSTTLQHIGYQHTNLSKAPVPAQVPVNHLIQVQEENAELQLIIQSLRRENEILRSEAELTNREDSMADGRFKMHKPLSLIMESVSQVETKTFDADKIARKSAQDAAEDQARATQLSSTRFLHRTVQNLRSENEKLLLEVETLRGASVKADHSLQKEEKDLREEIQALKHTHRNELDRLIDEIEIVKREYRAEKDRMTALLIKEAAENQEKSNELCVLWGELSLMRQFQSNFAKTLSNSEGSTALPNHGHPNGLGMIREVGTLPPDAGDEDRKAFESRNRKEAAGKGSRRGTSHGHPMQVEGEENTESDAARLEQELIRLAHRLRLGRPASPTLPLSSDAYPTRSDIRDVEDPGVSSEGRSSRSHLSATKEIITQNSKPPLPSPANDAVPSKGETDTYVLLAKDQATENLTVASEEENSVKVLSNDLVRLGWV